MIQFFSKRLYKNKKGFTIIELLVVIALLGILAGIALPRMTGVTNSAKTKADDASMTTLLKDTQVAIASGQLTSLDLSDDGVVTAGDGNYFPAGSIPTSQVSETTFTITVTDTDGDKVYDIVVSDADDESPRTMTGTAEAIVE